MEPGGLNVELDRSLCRGELCPCSPKRPSSKSRWGLDLSRSSSFWIAERRWVGTDFGIGPDFEDQVMEIGQQ